MIRLAFMFLVKNPIDGDKFVVKISKYHDYVNANVDRDVLPQDLKRSLLKLFTAFLS